MATESVSLAQPRSEAGRLSRVVGSSARWALLLVLTGVIVIPIFYAVIGGFKDNFQLSASPMAMPDPWVVSNYTDVLGSDTFWIQLKNSVLIAGITTVVVLVFASLAAFVFARRSFPGREVVFTLFTLGLLFPSAVAILQMGSALWRCAHNSPPSDSCHAMRALNGLG